MSDAERVKGLLDGSMNPSELEDDPELYALAERIYGREALEEMGVTAPIRPPEVIPEVHTNGNNFEVELPEHAEEDELSEVRPKSGILPSRRSIRPEERRVGKSVGPGGRRTSKKKTAIDNGTLR